MHQATYFEGFGKIDALNCLVKMMHGSKIHVTAHSVDLFDTFAISTIVVVPSGTILIRVSVCVLLCMLKTCIT